MKKTGKLTAAGTMVNSTVEGSFATMFIEIDGKRIECGNKTITIEVED